MSVLLGHVGTVLVVVGALVLAVAGVGLLRLPDLYTRASAVTTASGLGVGLVLVGVLLHHPGFGNTVKVGLAVVVQLATAAVSGFAIARAGYLTGAPLTKSTGYDDLGATVRAGRGGNEATRRRRRPGRRKGRGRG